MTLSSNNSSEDEQHQSDAEPVVQVITTTVNATDPATPAPNYIPPVLVNSKFACRMYENVYPEVNDLVMVTVQQIAEMGAYVNLNEYNNIEGMVLLSELSRRRIRSVQRLIRVGKTEVVIVLRVDKEKGYIDLSKRRVSPEEVEKFEEKYNKSKTVHSIMRHVAERRDMSLEELYQRIGWPLYRKFGHCYDAFKMAITEPDRLWAALTEYHQGDQSYADQETRNELMSNIVRRLTPQKVKIRADVEVACFAYDGVDAVRSALQAGEQFATEEFPLKIRLVAPPLYVMQMQCLDRQGGIQVMQDSIDKIDAVIKQSGGQIAVKLKPKVVSENDERELDALMKKSEMENAEVSGDEDESE